MSPPRTPNHWMRHPAPVPPDERRRSPLAAALVAALAILSVGCATAASPSDAPANTDAGDDRADAGPLKPLPSGVFKQIGGLVSPTDNPVRSASATAAIDGFGLSVPWDLCGDDEACLFDAIGRALDGASSRGLVVALAVGDGDHAPPGLKARCTLFPFIFRDEPATMCLAWDAVYVAEKVAFLQRLGAAFDAHPGLGYLYFTGACSSNGVEGHCRVNEAAYTRAGYTPEKLTAAYREMLQAQRAAFPTTPLAFEVHALFGAASPWTELWQEFGASGRVGVAAWWCAERMSVVGGETTPVFPLVQEAAAKSFAVCQTVASLSREPWRFSDPSLGLDYGSADGGAGPDDVQRAFTDTLDWLEGVEVHAGQPGVIVPFSVLEAWSADSDEPTFQGRLAAHH